MTDLKNLKINKKDIEVLKKIEVWIGKSFTYYDYPS